MQTLAKNTDRFNHKLINHWLTHKSILIRRSQKIAITVRLSYSCACTSLSKKS
ncbi:protein of unknown function [Oenococcus oeni]|uniref:Uncharacterized protein n=1 Tax=Oenococcus oeni TaxID=1247 RepID=A0AAQ2UUS7_OENOE|nr:hypothetical protein OENI_1620003 [Oenococcus oeni]VDB97507.1 protein of unknown function [Oenococcus oeni]